MLFKFFLAASNAARLRQFIIYNNSKTANEAQVYCSAIYVCRLSRGPPVKRDRS